MNQRLPFLVLIISTVFTSINTTRAQVIDTIFGCDEIPSSPLAGASCSICNFDILYGSTFPFTPSPSAGWCGTIENDQYIGFVAGATGTVVFEMTTFNCINGQGVQVGIYDQSNQLVGDCFNQVVPSVPQVFTASGLTPSVTYYIRIDGFAGDGCEFNIRVISGLISVPPPTLTTDDINSPTSVCLDEPFIISSIDTAGIGTYSWSLIPGLLLGDIKINGINTDSIVSISSNSEVTVDGSTSSVAPGECDTLNIELYVANQCFGSSNTVNVTIDVCRPSIQDTTQITGMIPWCEDFYRYAPTNQIYRPGTYYFLDVDAQGAILCDKIIELLVVETPSLAVELTGTPFICSTNEGSITATATGGTPPYTFDWSNQMTVVDSSSNTQSNLEAGNYLVQVTDADGCKQTLTYNISNANNYLIPVYINQANCDGQNGSIILDTSLLNTVDVLWSTGSTSISIDSLPVGNYSVALTVPATGCTTDTVLSIGIDSSCFAVVSGYVVIDTATTCQSPLNHFPLSNIAVECSNGQTTFTNSNGYYQFNLDLGTYTLSLPTIPAPANQLVCNPQQSINIVNYQTSFSNQDFYLTGDTITDISLTLSKNPPSRGRRNRVVTSVCNNGLLPASPIVNFVVPTNQTYDYSWPAETSISGNLITFDVGILLPGQCTNIRTYLTTQVAAMLGDTVTYEVYTDALTTGFDSHPDDNSVTCTDLVIASYDPNDKAATPRGTGPEGFIKTTDKLLQYTIRFENEGNAEALYVRLEDQISPNLNIATLKPIAGSHPYEVYYNEAGRMFVEFNDIVLTPTSVDSIASQGFFTYTIETSNDLEPGDQIENTAEIYFDFNDPIITNTTINTIEFPVSTKDFGSTSFILYPNPTRDELNITLASNEQIKLARIVSMDGRVQGGLTIDQQGRNARFDLSNLNLPRGAYTLELTLYTGERTRQMFVKE